MTCKSFILETILTQRELECFCLILYGKTARQIAEVLNLSTRTIEEYLLKIKKKLGAKTLSDVHEIGFKLGYIHFSSNLSKIATEFGLSYYTNEIN